VTDSEWQALNTQWAIAHPELADGWMPGQMWCGQCDGRTHLSGAKAQLGEGCVYELPPPDLRDGAVFLRVLVALDSREVQLWNGVYHRAASAPEWWWTDINGYREHGDTPSEALARALIAMEATK